MPPPASLRRLSQLCWAVPFCLAVLSLATELMAGPSGVGSVFFAFVYPLLMLAAPHAVWHGLSAAAQARPATRLMGLFVASACLLFIAAMTTWGPQDRSGLPYTWLLYWPLCAMGLGAVAVLAWTQQRVARRR